nr:nucleotidyltransferase [Rickettsia endosymbiont of Ceutorhynchus assimilis]
MKTTLPKRSIGVQNRPDYAVHQILEVAREQIAMIILFGSYARGALLHGLIKAAVCHSS